MRSDLHGAFGVFKHLTGKGAVSLQLALTLASVFVSMACGARDSCCMPHAECLLLAELRLCSFWPISFLEPASGVMAAWCVCPGLSQPGFRQNRRESHIPARAKLPFRCNGKIRLLMPLITGKKGNSCKIPSGAELSHFLPLHTSFLPCCPSDIYRIPIAREVLSSGSQVGVAATAAAASCKHSAESFAVFAAPKTCVPSVLIMEAVGLASAGEKYGKADSCQAQCSESKRTGQTWQGLPVNRAKPWMKQASFWLATSNAEMNPATQASVCKPDMGKHMPAKEAACIHGTCSLITRVTFLRISSHDSGYEGCERTPNGAVTSENAHICMFMDSLSNKPSGTHAGTH